MSVEEWIPLAAPYPQIFLEGLGVLSLGWFLEEFCPKLIVALPFSAEHGEFLALDLGGTNFRVLWVKVTDNGLQKVEMENQIYAIPEDIMRGSGTQVWPFSQGGPWWQKTSLACSFCTFSSRSQRVDMQSPKTLMDASTAVRAPSQPELRLFWLYFIPNMYSVLKGVTREEAWNPSKTLFSVVTSRASGLGRGQALWFLVGCSLSHTRLPPGKGISDHE